ncbi:uncharacterized protein LOC134826485 [Bolinopsis microptera]|uniref:uncharacterized protein LOC134826485 n=1 Tax=Bolinopsis microptera TaxID=2820187 RepID=UPI00307A3802
MTEVVSNTEEYLYTAEEELLYNVVETITVKDDEPTSQLYEETVISHSTAIQNDRDLVHSDFRRRESSRSASLPPPSRLYSDVLMVREQLGEPTHVTHTPMKRISVQESNYTLHKLQNENSYQDTLLLNQCLQGDFNEGDSSEGDSNEGSESDEELEDLPRFRTRLSACGPRAKESARAGRAIRSGTLSGDEIEILRNGHEQDHGIPMLNELRDTIPKLTITEPGNSMFYETAFPLHTPKSTANSDNSCYENTDYFTRMVIPVDGDDQKRLTISVEHYTSVLIEEEGCDDDPIYSQPIKPKTKKISRSECEDILEKCNVGDFMFRRNKETTILSVKVHTKVKHIKLEFDKDSVKVGKESFNSLSEMIKFYKTSVPVSLVTEPVFLVEEIDSQGQGK